MEEPLQPRAPQLWAGALREQSGEPTPSRGRWPALSPQKIRWAQPGQLPLLRSSPPCSPVTAGAPPQIRDCRPHPLPAVWAVPGAETEPKHPSLLPRPACSAVLLSKWCFVHLGPQPSGGHLSLWPCPVTSLVYLCFEPLGKTHPAEAQTQFLLLNILQSCHRDRPE